MQKYKNGDHVMIAKDLGKCMRHFSSDCEAIVIGSYKDQYGGDDEKSYTVHIKGGGQSSWYEEWQLSLIEKNRVDLLEKWEKELKAEQAIQSNLDWIFENGQEVIEHWHGPSIATLAKCFGLKNLWGPRGEGITYFNNTMKTLDLSLPFLERSDKEGWLKFCKTIKKA